MRRMEMKFESNLYSPGNNFLAMEACSQSLPILYMNSHHK